MSAPPAPATNRMAIAVMALVGLFIAFYLLAHALGWTGSLLCGLGDCERVQQSRYSSIGPVPVAAVGVAGYAVMLVTSVLGIQPGYRESRAVSWLLLIGGTVGFGFSLYLTYLEGAVIHAWCQWCVASAVLMTLIFLTSLPETRRLRRA
ncbi:MAG: vitamin K epoxide reductase family protein [Gemmatimonadetes bacterium]|nr:vitamin K epoxide reductase family protein [Gemmatimonadota bacterium]